MAKLSRAADLVGTRERLERRLSDARSYWCVDENPSWAENSDWRGGLTEDDWLQVGKDHLTIFETFAKALGVRLRPGVLIEWGCGGGANAVAFAPDAGRFIAADVSGESVAECVRQVRAVCDTPTDAFHIDIEHPDRGIEGLEGTCDVFLCLYVIELTAGPEEALRILEVAERLLVSGGMAMVQVKYRTADWRTRGYRRNYQRNLADMTTFGIDEFWLRAAGCGLTPRLITLVPENHLAMRYAYYALTKP